MGCEEGLASTRSGVGAPGSALSADLEKAMVLRWAERLPKRRKVAEVCLKVMCYDFNL